MGSLEEERESSSTGRWWWWRCVGGLGCQENSVGASVLCFAGLCGDDVM